MTNPTPVQLSEERVRDPETLLIYLRGCVSRADEDGMINVPADYIADSIALLTELQHSRVRDQRDLDITILLANIDSLMEVAGDLDPEDKAVIEQIRASSDARFIGRPDLAASPSPATGVRVKALLWRMTSGGAYVATAFDVSNILTNEYLVAERVDEKGWNATGLDYETLQLEGTLYAAKTACQADYESRILSALVEQP